jgi:tetraacyldisaccharide 4'-kinase
LRAPAFWQRTGIASALLAPVAGVYGWAAAARLRQPGKSAGVPVVCVGNPTLGGAGKTPAALAIGRFLLAAGERPFFLSRGYGGASRGPLLVDPRRHHAAEVGDEPLLLARIAPTVVARDRPAGAALARATGASVIVMDDGFQNPSLAKDFSALVLDGRRGIDNGRVFPAGPLRAPLEIQLECAQALIAVGEISAAAAVLAKAQALTIPVFRGRLEPDAHALAALAGRDVLAFAGIADPQKFFAMLDARGIRIRAAHAFADHHRYSARDAARLLAETDRYGFVPVTTEKDLARISGDPRIAALAARAQAVPVELVLDRAAEFQGLVLSGIGNRGSGNGCGCAAPSSRINRG